MTISIKSSKYYWELMVPKLSLWPQAPYTWYLKFGSTSHQLWCFQLPSQYITFVFHFLLLNYFKNKINYICILLFMFTLFLNSNMNYNNNFWKSWAPIEQAKKIITPSSLYPLPQAYQAKTCVRFAFRHWNQSTLECSLFDIWRVNTQLLNGKWIWGNFCKEKCT